MQTTTAPHRGRSRPRGGYTLIDVTLTIFIIGLFAAIGVPRYGQLVTQCKIDSAAKQMVADLQLARHQAKLRGTTQAVEFDPAANLYSLPGINDFDHPEKPYLVNLSAGDSTTDLLSVAFGASGIETTIVFNMYGKPDFGGSVVIQAEGNQRTIRVDGTTGAVSIQP